MKKIFFIACFLFSRLLLAQEALPFVKYEKNKLYFTDDRSVKNFFTKLKVLDSQKKGKVNIVHIGDSHIQADFFSGKTRQLLQEKYGDGGRGFVFPYTAAQTNNPHNYESLFTGDWNGKRSVKADMFSRWGLAGVSAATYSPNSTITIQMSKESSPFRVTKAKIYYPVFDKNMFHAKVSMSSKNLLSKYLSREGFVEYVFKNPVDALTVKLEKNNATQNQFVLQGISLENDQAGIVYHSVGVNGAQSDTYFRCEDFNVHLKSLQPDLIVISLGTNDAFSVKYNANEYKDNMRSFVNDIRQTMPNTSIILTTVGDSFQGRRANPNNGSARQKVFELADEMHLAVWDLYDIMGGYNSILKWQKLKLAQADRLHLTKTGYEEQGKLFYEAIQKSYLDYFGK